MTVLKKGFAIFSFLLLQQPGIAHEGEDHGDHNPHHGGFVMMYQDLHFELVARQEGGIEVYYTDAIRNTLPAVVASDVTVEIEREGESVEYVEMMISDAGDYWIGTSRPVKNSRDIIRLGFLFDGTPLLLDVRASNMPEPDEHGHHGHEESQAGSAHHAH